jgi:hypothetical protein
MGGTDDAVRRKVRWAREGTFEPFGRCEWGPWIRGRTSTALGKFQLSANGVWCSGKDSLQAGSESRPTGMSFGLK